MERHPRNKSAWPPWRASLWEICGNSRLREEYNRWTSSKLYCRFVRWRCSSSNPAIPSPAPEGCSPLWNTMLIDRTWHKRFPSLLITHSYLQIIYVWNVLVGNVNPFFSSHISSEKSDNGFVDSIKGHWKYSTRVSFSQKKIGVSTA